MYEQYPFSEQKQQEENVNEKETDPIWSQFFPVEKPGRLCPWGHKRIGYDLVTKEDHAKNIFKSKRYFLTSSAALKIAFKKR